MFNLFDELRWRAEAEWRQERLLKDAQERRLSKLGRLQVKRASLFELFRLQELSINGRLSWKL